MAPGSTTLSPQRHAYPQAFALLDGMTETLFPFVTQEIDIAARDPNVHLEEYH